MPPSPARPQTAPNNVPWKRGEYLTFFAKMKIRVGGHNGNESIEIPGGDEFEYDGMIVRYAGREFPQPNMRAAIRDGWATLGDDDRSSPAPFVSSRDVAKSQSKTTDLSRVQRNVRQRFDSDSLDEETVLEVSDRKNVRDSRSGVGHLTSDHNRRAAARERGLQPDLEERMAVSASELDEQDGVEISRIRTPANLSVDLTKKPNAARDIELSMDHEKGVGRFAGERRTRPNIVEREGVTIRTSVGNMDRSAAVDVSDSVDGGRQVGTVRHSSKGRTVEGVSVEDTSGDRTRKAAQVKEPSREAPAKSTKPTVKPRIPDDAPQKLKMAIRRYPDFPVDWNFFAKSEDKLLRIKKLGANPDLLDAVYTAESPAMRKLLEQKFKSHFS
jgi:hypothetical protein